MGNRKEQKKKRKEKKKERKKEEEEEGLREKRRRIGLDLKGMFLFASGEVEGGGFMFFTPRHSRGVMSVTSKAHSMS